MSYPFEDNPLDDYLDKRFKLRVDELSVRARIEDESSSVHDRNKARKELREIGCRIRELDEECWLEPRNFDVFRSRFELALEGFEQEYPRPDNGLCKHETLLLTRRTFRNNSVHVVRQCQDCGRQKGALSKYTTDVSSLPAFDESLPNKLSNYHNWWHAERDRIVSEVAALGNEAPTFPYSDFEQSYLRKYPSPYPEECAHENKDNRLRRYPSGGDAVVSQCVDCGKHLSSVSKKSVSNWQQLPPYDESLSAVVGDALTQWRQDKYDACELAKQRFFRDVQARINAGEIQVQDNSKLGKYYESVEWQRTRKRIFDRDDQECQACGAAAECVHHIVYSRLGAENDLDLISLCNACHDLIHLEQRKLNNWLRLPPKDIRCLKVDAMGE